MICTLILTGLALSPKLPALHVSGGDLLDPSGKRVLLKGCNLGNWLVIEPWMLATAKGFGDQYELEQILADRFGEAERERLMDLYRSSWITPRDFMIIRSFGMNVVRLPMNYRLMEDDAKPFHLRQDAWQWIDKAVGMAEREGIYTILDMHGAQGGQSVYDHTGRAGQNKLWTDETNQRRLAWLWSQIAHRYRNRSAVVAYDVFNEPYGGTKPQQVEVFSKLYKAVRAQDSAKLIYAHGNYDNFSHYGNPRANGWKNVGFEMHYYPGLFGNGPPTVLNYARHLASLPLVDQQVRALNVPFLVGEMNVVFKAAGGAAMMRRAFDTHAKYGWGTTMWAYKVLSKEGGIGNASWGMVTNSEPEESIDFRSAPRSTIERYFSGSATQPYEIYEELRRALSERHPKLPTLPKIPEPIMKAPADQAWPGWTSTDLGNALKGGLVSHGSELELYGAGADIRGPQDQFRFLHKSVSGNFDLTATLRSLLDTNSYAKAGLMWRQTLDPGSATVLISAFPSGELQVAVRDAAGQSMRGTKTAKATFPVRLRLRRTDGVLEVWWSQAGVDWQFLDRIPATSGGFAGAIALSHDNRQLTRATYKDLTLLNQG